ncbi:MAG: indole-3-glycerol phosphate synthase TrpC [bacterium]|nr:indole-3-glycerol phosphate synthase TrpC [bacterium]
MNYLKEIIRHKRIEIEETKRKFPIEMILDKESGAERCSLRDSILNNNPALICEIKRKSPSKGDLRVISDPVELARTYEDHGATAISVLTDMKHFSGSIEDLVKVKVNVSIPVLRKDFIIDPYQIYESRSAGADAILLIAGALKKDELCDLHNLAYSLDLEVLLEVENIEDIEKARDLKPEIIGINNRNLRTFEQSIDTSFELVSSLPSASAKISESGISSVVDINLLSGAGFDGFLIGETFMRAEKPGKKLIEFIDNFRRGY